MRRLACLALLALTACSSPAPLAEKGAIFTPSLGAAAPLGDDEVIWLMFPGGQRGPAVAWFATVRPLHDGTGAVEFGERDDPASALVLRRGVLSADDYTQLWEAVESSDVWSLPSHPPGAVVYTDPYALGVRCLVQRDGRVFHHQRPVGCRVQCSPFAPSDDERQRYVGFVDTVRAVAKRAATDVVPTKRSH